ncbi:hypothetical protein [Culicoidibacter larvae]|uniref:Uncharacterized protein n=1 Tax=Culicoidibacter larvae TaxID=2579976 RepID=A0A5R8QGG9_9FIRM|nr:hypothetical protein [Culicoidibacter larvae]TLG77139.1 hypothetical protein FEZ08_00540 [Culicoidibacter larvae]
MSKKYIIALIGIVVLGLVVGAALPLVTTWFHQNQDPTYKIAEQISAKTGYQIYSPDREEKDKQQLQQLVSEQSNNFYKQTEELFGYSQADFQAVLVDAPKNRTLFSQLGDPYYYAIYEFDNYQTADSFMTMSQLSMQGYVVGFGNYVLYMPLMFDASGTAIDKVADQSIIMAEFVNEILVLEPETRNVIENEQMKQSVAAVFGADKRAQDAGQKEALVFTNTVNNVTQFNNFIIYEQALSGVTNYARYAESGTNRPYHIIMFNDDATAKTNMEQILAYADKFNTKMYCVQKGNMLLFFFNANEQDAQNYVDAFLGQ